MKTADSAAGSGSNTFRPSRSRRFKSGLVGWLFIAAAVLMIAAFYFYPMIQALILSFKTGTGMNLKFNGLANYERLFTDTMFLSAVSNTFIYLLFQVPIMIIFALFISVLLNDRKLKFKGFFRTAIFLPCITSLVAYSIVFKYLFAPDGLVNAFLLNIHLIGEPIQWLTHPFWAKVTIIIAITWRWTGYNMIFYLSGLQNIDQSIYEAARIDGASAVRQFFSITVPLLKPIILFTSITSTIGTLQLFDEVMNITRGGPGNATTTISQYIYNLSFEYSSDFGYAATVSYSIVIMIVVLSFIQFKVAGDRNA
ncbi:carbohydrate ABC transporter permease [Saccharibacillus kuerlensis]|uniref:Lactose ABC transporter permease n=1 Tax=Saccharibacillus kuerlensis TaxID=459527 RepID=A0ABQ2L4T8_9BACL|nr:sugar ABC transporter permease [Saccharibacillus kuerlensis]GGO03407.1 lactose ABC transporter permease [Saccharibacillus kuerlensis]